MLGKEIESTNPSLISLRIVKFKLCKKEDMTARSKLLDKLWKAAKSRHIDLLIIFTLKEISKGKQPRQKKKLLWDQQ